jgi:DNA polymerase
MPTVSLGGPTDAAGFRRAARALVQRGVPPDAVHWRLSESASLFDAEAQPQTDAGTALKVPAAFVALTETVALHRDPQRFTLLYHLLWRLQHEPTLRHDPLDPQWLQAERMAKAVRHDCHKMKAYVRFRTVARGPEEAPLHVAWFEPEHHIVEAVAPFFVERFAQLHWTVLTPQRCVRWDGAQLQFSPGANAEDAPPPDAGEALWLTYYAHIFNPARLKLATMQREMPRRYWHNLPEAVLIQPLAAAALQRSAEMVAQAPTEPARVLRREAPRVVPLVPAALPAAASVDERQAALIATAHAAGHCSRCPLHAAATQTVFGTGPVDAALMFVGEQPGDQEDLRGQAFIGPAGQLLDQALAAAQIDRQRVYVTNAVKHFKFELRGQRRLHKTAAQQEAAACLDWLEREITLVQPKAIVALGATAARALLGRPVAVLRERGQWQRRADGTPVLVTLHPSALLRMPPGLRADATALWRADLAQAAVGPGQYAPA